MYRTLSNAIQDFMQSRSHDTEERIRLRVFIISSLLQAAIMILHLSRVLGISHPALLTITCINIGVDVTIIALYIKRRVGLIQAFFYKALLTDLLLCMRIVYIVLYAPEDGKVMIVGNIIGAYTVLLYLTLGFVPRAPIYATGMNLLCLVFVKIIDGSALSNQFVILFTFLQVFTCILAVITYRGLHSIQQETNDYQDIHTQLLKVFHMSNDELNAYLQLCRGRRPHKQPTALFMDKLDEQSRHNLIEAVEALKKQRDAELLDLAKQFPMLTAAEQEVCRLVVAGKTVGEIARITDKSVTNISTVRGHIRRKLGLETGEDLRTRLIQDTQKK